MAYIEIKERNRRRYYYLTESVRKDNSVRKKRRYLGINLSKKEIEVAKDEFFKKRTSHALERIAPTIVKILKKEGVKKAGIFGSYARGEQKKGSDVDIIIELPGGMGFGFAGLAMELEEALKRRVDLITYKGISPYLKDKILEQEVRII